MAASSTPAVDVLSRALEQTANVLAAIPASDLPAATPCGDWTVASLIAHVVAAPRNFVLLSTGQQPDWSAEPPLPDDWMVEFRAASAELVEIWRAAGESAAPQAVDWQTAEFAVHTWDLARATGQSTDLDPEVAQRGLDFMSAALTPDNRGVAFGPAVPVADDAPIYDRLAAFAGRALT